MATLAGTTIASTYPLLLKIDSSGIDGTLRAVEDGDGTDSALSIATDSVLVKGDGVKLYFYDADGGEHISADASGNLTIGAAVDIILAGTAVNITADTIDLSDATKDVTLNASVDALNFDSNTLSIDASNNRIGIGTASPNHTLDIETTATQPTLRLFSTITPDGSKTGGTLRLGLHQDDDSGSGANDTQDGDVLGKILFEGQGTDYSYQGGIIQVEVETGDGTATRTEQGTQMSFWTMDTSGASAERRMTIDEDGDVTVTGDLIIDSNDKALVLGAGQDVSIFANAPGEMFITRGTDVTPVLGDTEGWFAFAAGDESASYFQIFGGEGGDALLYLYADGGDDDVDKWRMSSTTGGDFLISGAASGSFVDFVGISGTGHMVKNKQAAFCVHPASGQTNLGTGTTTVVWGTERFDQGGNFASNTFTAPATGRYQLQATFRLDDVPINSTYISTELVTSNFTYSNLGIWDPAPGDEGWDYAAISWSILVDMDTNDTAHVTFVQSGGDTTVDVQTPSFFSGFLAC